MTTQLFNTAQFVQAMRDNGYKNAAYALAELMDNSIQAGATQVELLCGEREFIDQRRRMRIEQIAVLDNGCGMDAKIMEKALQFGNGTHLTADTQKGMGRFGMGLPSASISQCKRVDVWSWQNDVDSALHTYLDLDAITAQQQRSIPEPKLKEIPDVWRTVGKSWGKSGTLVVWSKIDRAMWRTAQAIIDNSEFLIGRMYRKFLTDGTTTIRLVSFNMDQPMAIGREEVAKPNDPGYLIAKTSCPAPFDGTPMFDPWGDQHFESVQEVEFRGEIHPVTIRFSYAKEQARTTPNAGALPHGKHAARNVGVSLMRAERELELDQSWVIQYDPVERWWGVEVDFPPALDELFGVTNNKQSARNFSELVKLNVSDLTKGLSVTAAKEELEKDEDPRAPLVEVGYRIETNIRQLRRTLTAQTAGMRTVKNRHPAPHSPEAVATAATRDLQDEGHTGISDKDEHLPEAQRVEIIENSLIDEGVQPGLAHDLAATTVAEGLKYVFAQADLETPAFFSVKPRGGAIVVVLNTTHPAYKHLVEILDKEAKDGEGDAAKLQARLSRASDGLKLLLTAWARYEDEQPDGRPRERAQEARTDWGRIARRFLSHDE